MITIKHKKRERQLYAEDECVSLLNIWPRIKLLCIAKHKLRTEMFNNAD